MGKQYAGNNPKLNNKNKNNGNGNSKKVHKSSKREYKTVNNDSNNKSILNKKDNTPHKSAKITVNTPSPKKGLSALQSKFAKKLQGSRFRVINESLYTKKSNDSFTEFQQNPELFNTYHIGFREQASQWPENPLDTIIKWINNKMNKKLIIADMGCGDARLSQSVKNKVYSFDLVSTAPHVIAADIAHVPLESNSIDIVIFCLSLMGTNITDFILEAYRILKIGGILKIIEVRSRFETEDNGIRAFLKVIKNIGFNIKKEDANILQNKMFFMLEGIKTNNTTTTTTHNHDNINNHNNHTNTISDNEDDEDEDDKTTNDKNNAHNVKINNNNNNNNINNNKSNKNKSNDNNNNNHHHSEMSYSAKPCLYKRR